MASCPKCKAKIGIRTEVAISIPSSADRNPEGNAGIIYGRSCIICGYYHDVIQIAKPRVPETPKSLARPTGRRTATNSSQYRGQEIRDKVKMHMAAVKQLHQFGAQASVICRMLTDNGIEGSGKTLRKHYRELLAEASHGTSK